jgi:hypothetical protein
MRLASDYDAVQVYSVTMRKWAMMILETVRPDMKYMTCSPLSSEDGMVRCYSVP